MRKLQQPGASHTCSSILTLTKRGDTVWHVWLLRKEALTHNLSTSLRVTRFVARVRIVTSVAAAATVIYVLTDLKTADGRVAVRCTCIEQFGPVKRAL